MTPVGGIVGDVRHAVRSLWRSPPLSLMAIVLVALGIGAILHELVADIFLSALAARLAELLFAWWMGEAV